MSQTRDETVLHNQSASEALGGMIAGGRKTQVVYVAAKLGIADQLADGPKDSQELAEAVGAHPRMLHRLMRALVGLGVFAQDSDDRFHLEHHSQLLRSDVPGSLRSSAVMAGEPWFYGPYGELIHAVKTGETAFDHVHGKGLFDYLDDDPEAAAIFNDAMTDFTAQEIDEVVDAYDFSGMSTLVDIGGGHGGMMAAVLNANPEMHGVLFDQPKVVDGAKQAIAQAGLSDRCEIVGGDFFESVLAGADGYIMKWIIHDWDDDRSKLILDNCRRAIADTGRLLLVERVLPSGNELSSATMGDITMMAIPGGQERTREEYAELLQQSGFELTEVYPTRSEMDVIEAMPI